MKKLIASVSLLVLSQVGFSQDVTTQYDYKKVHLEEGITLVDGNMHDVESVAVSNDGERICFIGKKSSKKYVYPTDIFVKESFADASIAPRKIKKKILNAFSKCAFDNDGNIMASELKWRPGAIMNTLVYSFRTGDFEPKKYHSNLVTYDFNTSQKLNALTAVNLGQKNAKEFLKHPRISPDGKWITYYTMGEFSTKGVYVYNINTKKTIHLGDFGDKHPTWNEDGTKILFHFQKANRKQGEVETAYLGYYDMSFNGDEVVKFKRIMLDNDLNSGYVYHKHPALYPGTSLLFFHGQSKPDGRKKLYVRLLDKASKIYEVKMDKANVAIKGAKHPSASRVDTGLYFVGKEDQEGSKYKIFRLEPKAIASILEKLTK